MNQNFPFDRLYGLVNKKYSCLALLRNKLLVFLIWVNPVKCSFIYAIYICEIVNEQ